MTVPERLEAVERDLDEVRKGIISSRTLLRRHDGICNHYWALQKTIEQSPVIREHLSAFFDNPQFQQKGLDDLHSLARKAADQDYRFQLRQDNRDVASQIGGMDGKSDILH